MRQLTPIVKNLLIINVLCCVAAWVLSRRGIDLNNMFGLHFFLSDNFRPWQLFTYMFMHDISTPMHLFFNMFALWMFGCIIEHAMGTKRFITYYIICGIGAGICQEIAQLVHYSMLDTVQVEYMGNMVDCVWLAGYDAPVRLSSYLATWNTVGASGAIYAILLAFAMYFPDQRMFIIPIPVPIKAKYMVLGYAVIEVMETLTRANDQVAHLAHLGGMLFGLVVILIWRNMDKRKNQRGGTQYVSFDSYNRGY